MFEECRLEGDFTLTSGRKSGIFYDFDLLKPSEVAVYVEQLLQQVPREIKREISFIAAPALGGIVPGFLAAFAERKPLVIVEKNGQIRGPEFQSGKYLIVDDVISTCQAAQTVMSALPKCECVGVAAYIFRGSYTNLSGILKSIPAFYLSRKEQEE